MTAYFVLRTPSGPVRFRVNTEARDYEAVLVREEDDAAFVVGSVWSDNCSNVDMGDAGPAWTSEPRSQGRTQAMTTGLLLFALVDAILEQRAREAERDVLYIQSHDRFAPMGTHRLGQWRAQWWGTK